MPARSRLCRLTLASSPTLYRWRSARSRSLVSSFLPEIVSSAIGDDRIAEPVGPRDAEHVAAPLRSSTRKRERSVAGLGVGLERLALDLALGDAGRRSRPA